METWVALFRGINVGGHHLLAMKDLKRLLESLNLRQVRTYIQSGNAVFCATGKQPEKLAAKISSAIEQQHGFEPQVLVLRRADFLEALDANPFPQAEADHKSLHFYFLTKPVSRPDIQAMKQSMASTEAYHITDTVLYLYAPEGVGRSKLAANAERYLGVATTARNLRTVEKIAEMLRDEHEAV